ncbi:phosphatidate cytidylyltransferase [Pseudoduganella violaceinigra]|uniref:phosphatidate cytidylyltransferase n=1 Tax=Pseudoduganella violaceinigra TaxID=246602 RepID=UPI00040E9953|nr:phosphatidate cytidylyltransferase [Pseudoduganella violaceinigra]
MLKTRVITAVLLLAVLLPVLFSGYRPAVDVVVALFFAAAVWEAFRLFKSRVAIIAAAAWTGAFAYTFIFTGGLEHAEFWLALGAAIWLIRFTPALKLGLPPAEGTGNIMLSLVYSATLVSCFAAMLLLFERGPVYLLSVMAVVWAADIFAYFSGKAFGKHKLAPSISPGKSWEGAVGGMVAVLVLACATVLLAPSVPLLQGTFAVRLAERMGWGIMLAVLVLVVAASIVGDLFESMLKRRVGMKDSSNLLPGHGGVLDRIDALVPVLPIAALITPRLF